MLMPPTRTGLQFTNTHSTAILIGNKNLLNGSGVALDDYDGNNALYRSLDSTGNFTVVPASERGIAL